MVTICRWRIYVFLNVGEAVSSDQLSATPPRWLPLSTPGHCGVTECEETVSSPASNRQTAKPEPAVGLSIFAIVSVHRGPTVQFCPC